MLKNNEVTTRAVVIGRGQAGEGSARIFLYTEHLGLVTGFAKSAREERSKLRAHLQVGSFGLYTLVKGKTGWRITGSVDTKNTHFTLSEKDYAQKAYARVLSVVRQLVHGEEYSEQLFGALWNFLENLPDFSKGHVRVAEHVTVARIVYALGYVDDTHGIPYLESIEYDTKTVEDLVFYERQLIKTINEALLASNLT